jgi:(p)ppGpp synthase/HD superfamily hydrolase
MNLNLKLKQIINEYRKVDGKKLEQHLISKIANSKIDLELVKKAINWCRNWHAGQFRKSGELFYTHPMQVAIYCMEHMPKTKVIIAALLHDVVEDTPCTIEIISETFGARVAEMVHRLTRVRGDGIKLSVSRIIEEAVALGDREVIYIKTMDRIHNLQTLGNMPPRKKLKIAHESIKHVMLSQAFIGDIEIESYLYSLCKPHIPQILKELPQDENRDPLSSLYSYSLQDFESD